MVNCSTRHAGVFTNRYTTTNAYNTEKVKIHIFCDTFGHYSQSSVTCDETTISLSSELLVTCDWTPSRNGTVRGRSSIVHFSIYRSRFKSNSWIPTWTNLQLPHNYTEQNPKFPLKFTPIPNIACTSDWTYCPNVSILIPITIIHWYLSGAYPSDVNTYLPWNSILVLMPLPMTTCLFFKSGGSLL